VTPPPAPAPLTPDELAAMREVWDCWANRNADPVRLLAALDAAQARVAALAVIAEASIALIVAHKRVAIASPTGRLDERRRYFEALDTLEAAVDALPDEVRAALAAAGEGEG
jgi:hypothetical protein